MGKTLHMTIGWLVVFSVVLVLVLVLRHEPECGAVQYPDLADLSFGQPLATVVEARGVRLPADDCLRMEGPDMDWAWGGSWRCCGICWRGLCWQRRLLLWSVRPDDISMASAVPQWRRAAAAEVPAWSNAAAAPRCLTPLLLVLAVVLALLRWRRSARQPALRALRRLRCDKAAGLSADELAQIVCGGLGGAWTVHVLAGANVSPALMVALRGLLTELAGQLDRERYAGVQPTLRQRRSRLGLARYCLNLACALPAAETPEKTSRKGNGLWRGRDIRSRAVAGRRS